MLVFVVALTLFVASSAEVGDKPKSSVAMCQICEALEDECVVLSQTRCVTRSS